MGSRRVGHDRATSLSLFTFMHWRRKRQPTPVFLPGESQGWGSLVGCHLRGRTELDTTEVTQQQQQQQQSTAAHSYNSLVEAYLFVLYSLFSNFSKIIVALHLNLVGLLSINEIWPSVLVKAMNDCQLCISVYIRGCFRGAKPNLRLVTCVM